MSAPAPSALIRAAAAGVHDVRALTQPPPPSPRDLEIAALQTQLSAIEVALERQRREESDKIAAAYEEGRQSAEADLERQRAERAQRLDATLADASTRFSQTLDELERLALALSETALAAVFDTSADVNALTARAIKRQMRHLREASVVEIVVAAVEFADEARLAALRTQMGTRTAIRIDPRLDVGEARIVLKCGELELSRKDHWRALKDLLANLEQAP